jgi:uncharacterized protein (TIGR00299 family) protein
MMRIAYLDCFSGISGDMLLGALVDAGLPLRELRAELAKLSLTGYRVETATTSRAGIVATKLDVVIEEAAQPHRRLPEMLGLINSSSLREEDKANVSRVLRQLAGAEARVHGTEPDAVELHEVGAVDTIVDVTGAVVGLRLLGIQQLYCSALPVGSGLIHSAHGALPVPAPATLALLSESRAPLRPGPDIDMELVTPTGAALVAALARFERPAMALRATGYGAGSRDLPGRPNVLRLWLGETPQHPDQLLIIETNIDDTSPELLGYAQERLFAAGAVDVWFAPVQMKKNRPGVLLSAICPLELEQRVVEVLLRETSTLGVRVREITRHEAQREQIDFESSLGPVRVKVKRLPGAPPVISPEYELCASIARERGLPLADVYRVVQREAEEHLTP